LSSDPENLSWHSALTSTSSLTGSSVVSSSFGFEVESGSGSGVDSLFSLHDEAVLDELSDEYSGVSLSNLFGLVRIDPYSLLTAF